MKINTNLLKKVKYDEKFLTLSWEWLNDPEIKKLTITSDFTKEEQKQWYTNLSNKKNYMIWGITYNDTPIGTFGLKNITDTEAEYWGYIK